MLEVNHCMILDLTYPLVLVPFTSLLREFGTPELLKFVNVKPWLHSDVT